MADLNNAERTSPGNNLADRIIETAGQNGDVSAFHDEVNNLPGEERLKLVRDLNEKASEGNTRGSKFLYSDGQIDKQTNELVDLDLVLVDYTDGERSVTRLDLYTPGEQGKQFDKQQELNETVAPYQRLFNLMNTNGDLREHRWDDSGGDHHSRRDDNFHTVSNLLSKHTQGSSDKDALMELFKSSPVGYKNEKYQSVLETDVSVAHGPDFRNAPAEVNQQIDALTKENLTRRDSNRQRRSEDPFDRARRYIGER